MQARSVSALVLAFSLAVAAAASSGACNAQGEGQVCDVAAGNAGNDDCQSGLTCQAAPGAQGTSNAYRCCPTDLATATAAVCMLSISTGDASTAAVDSGEGATDGAVTADAADGATAADGAATTADSAAADGATSDATGTTSTDAAADATGD